MASLCSVSVLIQVLLHAWIAAAWDTAAWRFLSQTPPGWPLKRGLNALRYNHFPKVWPFNATDFSRTDDADDAIYYQEARLTKPADDNAIEGLVGWYDANLPRGEDVAILDLCASWDSHFPTGIDVAQVVGLGLNADELSQNKQLTEKLVHDLNKNPTTPFADASFDAIVNSFSQEYLQNPQELFKEFRRIAKPHGLVAVSFSTQFDENKAVKRWKDSVDYQRMLFTGSFFKAAGFEDVRGERVDEGHGKPMFVVYARNPVVEKRDEL